MQLQLKKIFGDKDSELAQSSGTNIKRKMNLKCTTREINHQTEDSILTTIEEDLTEERVSLEECSKKTQESG